VCPSQLSQAQPSGSIAKQGCPVYLEGFASELATFELGAPEAGANPFDNKVAFQLGNR
jgi:hypothetical protein